MKLKIKNEELRKQAGELPTSNVQHPTSSGRFRRVNALGIREVEPWHEVVDGKELLDELADVLRRFVVLPDWAAETLALWVLHTYAFELRDVSTYIGIESPEKRCGKTTLLAVLSELVCRPVVAANISSPAFFRVIEELRPTLLIDEADTFLQGNDELKGILNSGYSRSTAYVVRVANESTSFVGSMKDEGRRMKGTTDEAAALGEITNHKLEITEGRNGSRLASFSCWCPKVMAAIGRLPDTLADRCIVIRMQRKGIGESCERLRNLEAETLRRKCARFVLDHQDEIALARPVVPEVSNDRAADIWEPLFALADLAGANPKSEIRNPKQDSSETEGTKGTQRTQGFQGEQTVEAGRGDDGRTEKVDSKSWSVRAREAAVGLNVVAQEANPIGQLLLDILIVFVKEKSEKVFSRTMVQWLNEFSNRPWNEMTGRRTKEAPLGVTDVWLAKVLRPYGIRPATIRIGECTGKGYVQDDFMPVFQRYIPRSELEDLKARAGTKSPEQAEWEMREKELEQDLDECAEEGLSSKPRFTDLLRRVEDLKRLTGK